MSPSPFKAPSQTPPKVFRVFIRGRIDAVWNEITRTDDVIPCFFNNKMVIDALKPGSRLRMRSADDKWTGVVGEILEVDPPRRFSHTFKFTSLNDPECVVIYDLKEVEGGTEFTLTIENLPEGTKTAKQMVQGATLINNTLKAVIETGRPSFGVRVIFMLLKHIGPYVTPKRCRSENWP